jgi:hypothetical protein
MAILHLKKKMALGDFLHVIHNKPVASALLVQWCKVKTRRRVSILYGPCWIRQCNGCLLAFEAYMQQFHLPSFMFSAYRREIIGSFEP